ncbi:uncharacterized protein Tco025E_02856, partial [Trypanosoma conorhini]
SSSSTLSIRRRPSRRGWLQCIRYTSKTKLVTISGCAGSSSPRPACGHTVFQFHGGNGHCRLCGYSSTHTVATRRPSTNPLSLCSSTSRSLGRPATCKASSSWNRNQCSSQLVSSQNSRPTTDGHGALTTRTRLPSSRLDNTSTDVNRPILFSRVAEVGRHFLPPVRQIRHFMCSCGDTPLLCLRPRLPGSRRIGQLQNAHHATELVS